MKKIAIYPGTFDPITLGHLDVIETSAKIFDEVVVAILENFQKKPMFTIDERLTMIKAALYEKGISNTRVAYFNGLTIELARQKGAVAIIRGLRLVMDFESELDISLNNDILGEGIPTVFVPPVQKHIHIRSTTVRQLLFFSKTEKLSFYLPPAVIEIVSRIDKERRAK